MMHLPSLLVFIGVLQFAVGVTPPDNDEISLSDEDLTSLADDCNYWIDSKSICQTPDWMQGDFCSLNPQPSYFVLSLQDPDESGTYKIRDFSKASCYCDPNDSLHDFDVTRIPADTINHMQTYWSGLEAPEPRTESQCFPWVHAWTCHGTCLGTGWDLPTFFESVLDLYRKYQNKREQSADGWRVCFDKNMKYTKCPAGTNSRGASPVIRHDGGMIEDTPSTLSTNLRLFFYLSVLILAGVMGFIRYNRSSQTSKMLNSSSQRRSTKSTKPTAMNTPVESDNEEEEEEDDPLDPEAALMLPKVNRQGYQSLE
jgi:hypothetical protein